MSCVAVNGTRKQDATCSHTNAPFPLWREVVLHCIWTQTWTLSVLWAKTVVRQDVLTIVVIPKIEVATSGGEADLHQASFEQNNWQVRR